MKYVKKNPAKKSQTRMIAVLLVAVSVLSIGAGAAAMKFVSVKKDACAPLAADQVQTMALNADNQNTQMITAVEMTAAQNKSPMQLEAEKWFSPAELKTIAEADLAKMVQQRKEEYGKYLNAEEMKLTYAEKNFLYNKRTTEEAAKKQADAQMVLDITDMTMGIGDKVTLKAALLPAAKNATYIWQINDTSIATLTPNGDSAVITAKAAGTTTVTVSNGKAKETCIVRVKAAESFYLNTGSKTLVEGDYYTATASSKIASVKSSNNSVATVSFDGTKAYISAKNPGAATITVIGKNGKSATMAVTVEAYGLTLNKNQMNLTVGEWKDLYVTFGHTPTWYTSNANVARIHNTGKSVQIEAVGTGSATITAVSSNGAKAYCTINVTRPAEQLRIDTYSMTLNQGEMKGINVTSGSAYNWTSSNSSITDVFVVGDGSYVQVEGKQAGTAIVTAYAKDGTHVDCTVTVKAPVESLKLSTTAITMKTDEMRDIYVTSGTASNWTVNNENIAELYVVGDGSMVQIKAKAAGSAVINAFDHNNNCVTCYVTIEQAPMATIQAEGFEPIAEMVCEPLFIEETPITMEAPAPAVVEAPTPVIEEAPAPIFEETPAPVFEEAPAPVIEEAPVVMELAAEMDNTII